MGEVFYNFIFIGKGIFITLQFLMAVSTIGIFIGVLLSITNYKGIGKFFINRYIFILRGTPLILQLTFIYFALPGLAGIKLGITTSGIISLGLNSSAYIAAIFAVIESMPKGQFEASQVLRISKHAIERYHLLKHLGKAIEKKKVNYVAN